MVETRTSRKHQKRSSKTRKFVTVILVIILLMIMGGGAYAVYVWDSLKSTANKMHFNLSGAADGQKKVSNAKPINILLLGVDQRPNDGGRSDTIIVATLNPKDHSMLLTSIPRDTRTMIAGHGAEDKINSAYAYGGINMAVKTVENFANIHIDGVTVINFQALVALVNAVGGITVNNPIDWYDEGYYKKGYHYKKGTIHLDGPQALGFVRMRHLDPMGDFGRNLRQRLVIQALLEKGTSLTSVTNMKKILNALGSNVKTSFTFDDMQNLAKNYRSARDHVYDYEVKGTDEYINSIYYLGVDQQERDKVHQMIQDEKNGTLNMKKYDNSGSGSTGSSSSSSNSQQ